MATAELAEPTIVPAPKPAVALTHQLTTIVPRRRTGLANVVVIAVQAVVNAAEAMYVGWLGSRRWPASPWCFADRARRPCRRAAGRGVRRVGARVATGPRPTRSRGTRASSRS
jgi:hypothetical protein